MGAAVTTVLLASGTAFTDGSAAGHQLVPFGNTVLDNGRYKFGGVGTSDIITSPFSTDWQLGAQDFQISLTAQAASTAADASAGMVLIAQRSSGVGADFGWSLFHYAGKLWFYWVPQGGTIQSLGFPDPLTTLSRDVIVTRAGNTLSAFVNGALIGSGTITGAINASPQPLRIGGDGANAGGWNGWLSNISITRDIAAAPAVVSAFTKRCTELWINPDSSTAPSIDIGSGLGYLNTATGIGPAHGTWQVVHDLTPRFGIPPDAAYIDISGCGIITGPSTGVVLEWAYAAPSSSIGMDRFMERSEANVSEGGERSPFARRVPLETVNGSAAYKWWWKLNDWSGSPVFPGNGLTVGVNFCITGWGR